jgi:hypothetical protein
MTQPVATRTWSFSLNNRITFTSLNQTMGAFLYGLKNWLVGTMGYTLKYSCDGTTGPSSSSDHTDRWASGANAQTRAANTTTAQSWVVLTDGDGADFMLSYSGSADNAGRLAMSVGGLYTPAGTATFPATATDETIILNTNSDFIGGTASADRLWNAQATSDKKNWRAFVFRSGVAVGSLMSVEQHTSKLVSPASQAAPKWGIGIGAAGLVLTSLLIPTAFAASRVTYGAGVNVTLYTGFENFSSGPAALANVSAELQGANGTISRLLSLISITTGARGELGLAVDFWAGLDAVTDGTVTSDKKLIQLTGGAGSLTGVLLPWDGSTTPTTS